MLKVSQPLRRKMTNKIVDFIGIGIGPFNLGLAALASSIQDLDCLFFDQQEEFQWHPGMLLDSATLQVPFLADLVTMVDPTHPLSFLNYLKEHNRIYQFYIREDFFLLRKEYSQYCRWAISKLPSCRFSHRVASISYAEGLYRLEVDNLKSGEIQTYYCRKLVLGIGTSPYIPATASGLPADKVFHTSKYLEHKKGAQQGASISIIGSGQSAAEIFYDLLLDQPNHGYTLNWFTRSERFFPLEYSKLTLELTSPDFLDFFYHLPQAKKDRLVPKQKALYKGINFDLINAIYDELYKQTIDKSGISVAMYPGVELIEVNQTGGVFEMNLHHITTEADFKAQSEVIILATGYCYREPTFLKGIKNRIRWDEKGRYVISRNFAIDHIENEIFVQNTEIHTHGFITPDLGMAPLHNATILNQLLGREHFILKKNTAFQTFGPPTPLAVDTAAMANEALYEG